MKTSVWYMAREGDERRYAMPVAPTQSSADSLRAQGFRIFRIAFDLPSAFDASQEPPLAATLTEEVFA